MKWPTPLSGLVWRTVIGDRGQSTAFPQSCHADCGEIFELPPFRSNLLARFKLCQFSKCTFVWDGEVIGGNAKLFLSCNFDDCDFGMPTEEFVAYTFGSTVDGRYMPRLTRQQALEEAVRRVHQRQPTLTEQCLDPSSQAERERLAQWVSAEYRKILMDA